MALSPAASDPPGPPSFDVVILMCDTTDEGERLGAVLRTRGYAVVDVPVAGLATRARAVSPSLVICDLDVSSAPGALASLAEFGLGLAPRVIVFSDRGPATMAIHPALERLRAEVFPRPIDVFGVLRRVEALLGAPSKLPGGSLMPPSHRSGRPPSGSNPGGSRPPQRSEPSAPSYPVPTSRPSVRPESVRPSLPAPVPLLGASGKEPSARPSGFGSSPPNHEIPGPFSLSPEATGDQAGSQLPQPPMSAELQRLLAAAERKVRPAGAMSSHPPARLSPEAELKAVLPPEVLDALDEPLDDEEELLGSYQERFEDDSDGGAATDHGAPGRPRTATGSRAGAGPEPLTESGPEAGQRGPGARSPQADEVTPLPKRRGAGAARTGTGLEASQGEPGRDAAPDSTPESARSAGPPSDKPGPVPTAGASPAASASPRTTSDHAASSAPTHDGIDAAPVGGGSSLDPGAAGLPKAGAAAEAQLAGAGELESRAPQSLRTSLAPASRTASESDPPRRPTPPGPALLRLQDAGMERGSPPARRAEPLVSARGPGRGALGGFAPAPASGPPPSLPSNAYLAGGSLMPPRVSSGPPIVSAMPIPAQDLLDEPFGAPAEGARAGAPAVQIPAALHDSDAVRALALLVRTRYTGAVAFENARGIQRAVLRDGDFVTAASGIEAESLVAFLVQRGVLGAAAAEPLARRVPAFGRHAGAALIAHGHLRQDELWPVLRAHAEWILGRMLLVERAAASLEPEVPVRLKAEPAVFGGATGAEVLVEIVRRVVAPEVAARQLGGPRTRFGDGVAPALLGECALPDHEQLHVNRARSATLEEVLAGAKAPDFAAVLYALVELGVLDRRPSTPPQAFAPASPTAPAAAPAPVPAPAAVANDDVARRERIGAHLALVHEGDYFALLGVPRDATSYDIRRAYGTLLREFDPSQALTARTADLHEQLVVILEMLEEAFEILGDEARRARYRRAIEAAP